MICPHCGGDTDVEPLKEALKATSDQVAEFTRLMKEAVERRQEHIRRIYPARPPWNVGDIT